MKYNFLLLLLFFYGATIAQTKENTYIVSFEKKIIDTYAPKGISRIVIYPENNKISDYTPFKNIPDNSDFFEIFCVILDPAQEFYNRYKKNEIAEDQYIKSISVNDIDTTFFYDNRDINNHFYLYVGLDLDRREKKVIIDSNYNLDFSDDELYIFKLEDYKHPRGSHEKDSLCPVITLNNPFYKGTATDEPPLLSILLDPFNADKDKDKYSDENEFYLNVEIQTGYYKIGELNIDLEKVQVLGFNVDTNIVNKNINKKSRYRFVEEEDTPYMVYALGDTVLLANRKILLQQVVNNSLLLKEIESMADSSSIGSFLPDLYSKDLINNELIRLNNLIQDKYVFIDFWGSWCGPCIAGLPKLKELFDKIEKNENTMLLGIALERENDIPLLKSVIQDKEIKWLNVLNDYSTQKSLQYPHGKLKVNSFPTYIIVDKTGKIVYRATSEQALDATIDFFLYLIQREI